MALPDLPMSLFILVSHTTYILENVEGDDPCILCLSIIGRAAVGCFGQGWVNLNIGDQKLSPCKLKCKNSRVTQSSNNKRHPTNTPTMVSQSHSTLSYITHVAGSQSKINGAAGLLRRLTWPRAPWLSIKYQRKKINRLITLIVVKWHTSLGCNGGPKETKNTSFIMYFNNTAVTLVYSTIIITRSFMQVVCNNKQDVDNRMIDDCHLLAILISMQMLR